jgi:hypothetical protein
VFAQGAAFFGLVFIQPRLPLRNGRECQTLVRVSNAIGNRLESRALAQERHGVVIPVEFEHGRAPGEGQTGDEKMQRVTSDPTIHNAPPRTNPAPDGPAQGVHQSVG